MKRAAEKRKCPIPKCPEEIPGKYIFCGSMKQRCANPRTPGYANYGGRGISVCERWRDSFAMFLADMGPRPSQTHSLDRVDVNGNYEPGNCRWATKSEQGLNTRVNRRIEHGGLNLTIGEWARRNGLTFDAIRERLRKGWPVKEALETPLRAVAWRAAPRAGLKDARAKIRDPEIRAALHALIDRSAPAGSVVVDEYGIAHVCVADVAVFQPDALQLYEIKSDGDTVARLERQARFYSLPGPSTCTLVAGPKLLEKSLHLIPRWWGVIRAAGTPAGVQLETVRAAQQDPEQDPARVLSVLWGDEAWSALKERCLSRGHSKSGILCWTRMLAEALPKEQLRSLVFAAVARRRWLASRQPVRVVAGQAQPRAGAA